MRRDQLRASNPQDQVSPVPTTIWSRLPLTKQQQFAHLVAELIQRIRTAEKDKEREHER